MISFSYKTLLNHRVCLIQFVSLLFDVLNRDFENANCFPKIFCFRFTTYFLKQIITLALSAHLHLQSVIIWGVACGEKRKQSFWSEFSVGNSGDLGEGSGTNANLFSPRSLALLLERNKSTKEWGKKNNK